MSRSRPVPVYDHSNGAKGSPANPAAVARAPHYWATTVGGGAAPAVVAFDTVMPNGKTAHGGILSSDGRGGQHVVFHFREPRGS